MFVYTFCRCSFVNCRCSNVDVQSQQKSMFKCRCSAQSFVDVHAWQQVDVQTQKKQCSFVTLCVDVWLIVDVQMSMFNDIQMSMFNDIQMSMFICMWNKFSHPSTVGFEPGTCRMSGDGGVSQWLTCMNSLCKSLMSMFKCRCSFANCRCSLVVDVQMKWLIDVHSLSMFHGLKLSMFMCEIM